jgi:hypothetical protein
MDNGTHGDARATSFLAPETLSMPRQHIALTDTSVRVLNGRGAASPRDWTVCGIKGLLFPPALLRHYRFGLAFREHATGTLILDNQDEYQDPLYLNQKLSEPSILLSQSGHWQPNLYTRRGTFHKYLGGRLISFGITTRLSVSAEADEVFLEIDLRNRTAAQLSFTVVPDQRAATACRPDTVSVPLELILQPPQPQGVDREPCFDFRDGDWDISARSDLGVDGRSGWQLDMAANGQTTARFTLSISPKADAGSITAQSSTITARVETSQSAARQRLAWAAQRMPRVETASAALDEFYARSILTVLMCRLDRSDYIVRPFYDLGRLDGSSVLWDLSFTSSAIALLEPDALRGMVRAHLKSGIFNATYMKWNGNGFAWYAQSPFALLRIVNDYLAQTGDVAWLDELVGTASLYEHLCQIGVELNRRYARPDGLLDFGGGTGIMLEIRTAGYEHVVAATNGLASDYFQQLSAWGESRRDPRAAQFTLWSRQIATQLQQTLWDTTATWFANLYPDQSRHLVMSYHLFDLLDSPSIRDDQRKELVAHLKSGEFTGAFGLYSIARSDDTHYDREDCDWSGGGQYVGMSTRIAESLFRIGERALAWDILNRCTRWTERFPYWPQTIYADELALQAHQADWPLQLSGGGGIQAVVAGVFGVRPRIDGTLEFQPSCEPDLGDARLGGYRFRGSMFDVTMSAEGFAVFKDGHPVAQGRPGDSCHITTTNQYDRQLRRACVRRRSRQGHRRVHGPAV